MARWCAVQHEVPVPAVTKTDNEVLRDVTMDGEGLRGEAEVIVEVPSDHGRSDHRSRPLTIATSTWERASSATSSSAERGMMTISVGASLHRRHIRPRVHGVTASLPGSSGGGGRGFGGLQHRGTEGERPVETVEAQAD